VYDPWQFGYPLVLSGMVYEIGDGEIDVEQTKEFLYDSFVDDVISSVVIDSLTEHIQSIVANYAATSFQLAMAFEKQQKYEDALKALTFAKRFGDMPLLYLREAEMYSHMKKFDLADSTLEALLKLHDVDVKMKKEIARTYHDIDMNDKAIKLLAECLQEDPNDRESLQLIEEYQEE
jgi:tetratricopeptide (TPR) repeat protein